MKNSIKATAKIDPKINIGLLGLFFATNNAVINGSSINNTNINIAENKTNDANIA